MQCANMSPSRNIGIIEITPEVDRINHGSSEVTTITAAIFRWKRCLRTFTSAPRLIPGAATPTLIMLPSHSICAWCLVLCALLALGTKNQAQSTKHNRHKAVEICFMLGYVLFCG